MKRAETDKLSNGLNSLWCYNVSNILPLTENSIDCGYDLTEERRTALNQYLDSNGAQKLDLSTLVGLLNYNKELELMNETEYEANEYLDAFVALGGSPDREGTIKKEMLI